MLKNVSKETNVGIFEVPYRYDNLHLNMTYLFVSNGIMRHCIIRMEADCKTSISLMMLDNKLRRDDYTRHDLHLNGWKGKKK